jgi:tetratricopeptide (TPR) repeat protein
MRQNPTMARSTRTHIDDPRRFGRRLKESRLKAGLSQGQLSFPGCTTAYISRLESGARVASLQLVNELAVRLNVSPQWLATGVEPLDSTVPEIVDAEVALRLGDLDEARRLYSERLQPGDPARASALAGLGQIAFREERIDEAVERLEQAIAARDGNLLLDPGTTETLGRAYAAQSELARASALFERALEQARQAEAPVEKLRFSVLLANCHIDRGAFGDAEQTLAGLINLAGAVRDPLVEARVFWSQSRLHVLRGESQLAARYARRALAILERTENDAYVAMAYHLLAYAEIEAGNGSDALELLGRGRALFGPQMTEREDAKFALEEARAHASCGDNAAAARAASRALELIDAIDPGDRGRAYASLGDVFLESGDRERAKMTYGMAIDLLLEHGKPYVVATAVKLSDMLETEGDTAGALTVLRRATAGSHAPVEP